MIALIGEIGAGALALWSLWDALAEHGRGNVAEATYNVAWGIYGWVLMLDIRAKRERAQ